MKCQFLFSGKSKKKYIKMLSAEIFSSSTKHYVTVSLNNKGSQQHAHPFILTNMSVSEKQRI